MPATGISFMGIPQIKKPAAFSGQTFSIVGVRGYVNTTYLIFITLK
jgi:hypothetical protein